MQPLQGARIKTKLDALNRKEASHNFSDDALVVRETEAPQVQGLLTVGPHHAHLHMVAADQTARTMFSKRRTLRGQLALRHDGVIGTNSTCTTRAGTGSARVEVPLITAGTW